MTLKAKYDRRGGTDCWWLQWNGYRDILVRFLPLKYWENKWVCHFLGWDCFILEIETPWVAVSMDLRARTPSAIRDFRE